MHDDLDEFLKAHKEAGGSAEPPHDDTFNTVADVENLVAKRKRPQASRFAHQLRRSQMDGMALMTLEITVEESDKKNGGKGFAFGGPPEQASAMAIALGRRLGMAPPEPGQLLKLVLPAQEMRPIVEWIMQAFPQLGFVPIKSQKEESVYALPLEEAITRADAERERPTTPADRVTEAMLRSARPNQILYCEFKEKDGQSIAQFEPVEFDYNYGTIEEEGFDKGGINGATYYRVGFCQKTGKWYYFSTFKNPAGVPSLVVTPLPSATDQEV